MNILFIFHLKNLSRKYFRIGQSEFEGGALGNGAQKNIKNIFSGLDKNRIQGRTYLLDFFIYGYTYPHTTSTPDILEKRIEWI